MTLYYVCVLHIAFDLYSTILLTRMICIIVFDITTLYIIYVMLASRPTHFSRALLKRQEWPGNDTNRALEQLLMAFLGSVKVARG